MIVCVCRAVSDRTVRAAISAGAGTVEQVGAACRAGTCCGSCRPQIAALLVEARAAAAAAEGAPAAGGEAGACAPAACAARGRCASPLAGVASAAL
jgi:bacterioferritin-associated ferredoxin